MNLRCARVILGHWTLLLFTARGGTPSATIATVQPPTPTVVPSPQPSATGPSSGFTAGTYTTIVTEADVTEPDLAANVGSWRVRFTLYPNAGHEDTWRQAYADTELYTWLLSQTLR